MQSSFDRMVSGTSRFFNAWTARPARAAIFALIGGAMLLSGCAALPAPPAQPPSTALADPNRTPLGQLVTRARPPNAPGSGFRVLVSGAEAFDARLALADAATRTLDLQYYIVASDKSSQTLLDRVRDAARRGVRVRVLLDDLNTSGGDAQLLPLIEEPNVEVRLFNPFPAGRMSTMTRVMASLGEVSRINKRMHNKLFVADNALAITGGRNLGDSYFIQSESSNFVDLDVLVAGSAVPLLSQSFDGFWNNPLAYPARMFIKPSTAAASSASTANVDPVTPAQAAAPASTASTPTPSPAMLSQQLPSGKLPLTWAGARVLVDQPSKIREEGGEVAPDETLVDDMSRLLLSAKREVLLISPYFVPGPRGLKTLQTLRARGVSVQILTNSLAANDAPLVHVGYAKYRERLLEAGIVLSELKPSVGSSERRIGEFGRSTSRLHAKALVIDREWALIGTMNFDPRSDRLNTEAGVLIHSAPLAQQVTQLYAELARDGSFRLSLDDQHRVQWTDPAKPLAPAVRSEPGAKLWLRTLLKVLGPFAPEEML